MIRQFTSKTQRVGEMGEDTAVIYLKKQGFTIIERNVPNKYGEIDIVAKKNGLYAFYEVKTGRQGSWFNPAENMTKEKIGRFLVSVEHYCLVREIKQYTAWALIVRLAGTPEGKPSIEVLSLS